jgi:hypothetical protein
MPRHSQHPLAGSGHTLARNLSLGVSFIGYLKIWLMGKNIN